MVTIKISLWSISVERPNSQFVCVRVRMETPFARCYKIIKIINIKCVLPAVTQSSSCKVVYEASGNSQSPKTAKYI